VWVRANNGDGEDGNEEDKKRWEMKNEKETKKEEETRLKETNERQRGK
jgi:hypothetical protein